MANPTKPLLGTSSCLLGNHVRFDGGHKQHHWMVREFAKWVHFHPVCPEMAMGLGAPRESLRLHRSEKGGDVRMVTSKSGKDVTEHARETARHVVSQLPQHMDGFVLKNRSPSCGLERVKVYDQNMSPSNVGTGFFAQALQEAYPHLPICEEGHLFDPVMREHFVTRVFAHHALSKVQPDIANIQKFHRTYKFLIMCHDEFLMRQLGKIAANAERLPAPDVLEQYQTKFAKAMSSRSNRGRKTNVLQHILGFFKTQLTKEEKQSINRYLERYRTGDIPYVAIHSLVHHITEKYDSDYIAEQKVLAPYPQELRLVNGV